MIIDASTQLNLVIGKPIRHSQSPSLHQAFYDKIGLNAVLLAIEPTEIDDLIQTIKTLNIQLTAVTLPFKTEVIQYADHLSDSVKVLGAANTLIYRQGQLEAHNTDVDGIKACLKKINLDRPSVLIIGAGGAARALAYALQDYQPKMKWFNRTESKAAELSFQWGGEIIREDELVNHDFDLIINTTSVGMSPEIEATPLPGYPFKATQTVFDMIYTPEETRLLKDARAAGATCVSGKLMFETQARKQIELTYGIKLES